METLPESAPPSGPARIHFHLALAGIIFPPVGLLMTLGLAVWNSSRANPSAEDRRWTRRLFGLVFVDLVVVLCVAILYGRREEPKALSGPVGKYSDRETVFPPRIGVLFDPKSTEPRLHQVVRGRPADRAGLKAGDLVLKIDGAEIRTSDEMRDTISQGQAGIPRRLLIDRGGERLEVDVTPEVIRFPEKRGLMETSNEMVSLPWIAMALSWLVPLLLVGAASWLVARRRGAPKIVVWRVVAICLGASMASAGAALVGAKVLMGGWSLFGMILALNGQVIALLVVSLLFLRRLKPVPPPPGPFLSPLRTTALAVLYLVTGYVRLTIVLFALLHLLGVGQATSTIETITRVVPGLTGFLMISIDVVLVGPIAEELLFRGLLLPRLAAQLGGPWALWASALLFASLHFQYGLYTVLVLFYGLILGWARWRSGGLKSPILLHVLINAIAMGGFLLSR